MQFANATSSKGVLTIRLDFTTRLEAFERSLREGIKPVRMVYAVLLLLIAPSAFAEWGLNMPEGVTRISQSVHGLHMTIFYICCVIAVIVFGVMLYSIIYHRKSRGAKAANFHESTTVEIIWTIIPLLILIGMAVPATSTLIDMYDSSEAEVDVQITGYQWKWRYTYLNDDVDFFSNLSTPQEQIENQQDKSENYLLEVDNPLVLPVNTKVRFLMTAEDVIHSWWVPELSVKKDTIPGFINEAWTIIDEPGVYRGQCTELCGAGHGFMPIVVKAIPKDEYQMWITEQAAIQKAAREVRDMSFDELMEQGKKVYGTYCAACHKADGSGMPPVFPALKDSAIAKGDIVKHIDIVVNGAKGTAMAAFGDQLSVSDIASVVTYERNAWGNDMGDSVSPKEVKEFKENK
ncbi:cytochrome c oxidase subunit II [Bermanella marisrubri]|uniref:Cytochrome c oxidase subunit 2 n=1 Tax=Bermanella marisrubri TaxID=207949 RepID=Q1N2M3_9GAMM|nr:cytochrome-c oxidase, subunit II [Oceanobacter sp. RED65] [Bermanella marisrubri]